jgi:hypothetical protein
MIISLSSCLNPRLTFLNSACISFTPIQVYSLLHIYHQATMLCFPKCLLITMLPVSARVSPISSRYPTECRSTFEPCHHDLTRAQCYKSWPVFLKITENRWNRTGLNLKTVEFTIHCFKIQKKIKISKIYVKKLDRILRLLVKNFCKIWSFGLINLNFVKSV